MKNTKNINKIINNTLNVWDVAKEFSKSNANFKYCKVNKCFFNYDEINKLWYSISIEDIKVLLLNFIISKYPNKHKYFNPRNTEQIIILLQRNSFSMPSAKNEANASGLLISFKDCVFNCKTKETLEHKPEFYITNTLNSEYDPNAKIVNTPMAEFLTHICNNNPDTLAILRACLYLIFTNNLTYQVALYIYGPGGTGKSTFTNIIMHLLGPSSYVSTSLKSLQSRFGISTLRDKLLLLISELPSYLGTEPTILKNIIGGDVLTVEEKYKNPIQIISSVFLIITSNTLWSLKNVTTGMARRIIYISFLKKPVNKVINLFNLGPDNKASGILVEYLPGFINWIISCPKPYLDLLKQGGEHVTNLIDPDSLIKTNPIKAWVLERLVQDSKGIVKIGDNKSGLNTLYGNYLDWCKQFNVDVGEVKFTQFSPLLINILISMNWNIEKKRTKLGVFIQGVKLADLNSPYSITTDNSVQITEKDFDR